MSFRARALPAVLVLLLSACASSGDTPSGDLSPAVTKPGSVTPSSTGAYVYIPADQSVVSEVMEATSSDAWHALMDVFEEAEIPVVEQDLEKGIVANHEFTVRRHLLGQRLSSFLGCGDSFTGPVANSAQIEMDIRAQVFPVDGRRVRIDMLVGAKTRPTQGTSTEGGACNSSRRLEREILKRVQLELIRRKPPRGPSRRGPGL